MTHILKPGKVPQRSEEDEQRSVAQYLDMRKDLLWCHVPNGGARNIVVGRKLKAQGVKPGVPDILIFNPPNNGYVGTAIELKRRDGGSLQESQIKWLKRLGDYGWDTNICHGSGQAIELIERLYGRI